LEITKNGPEITIVNKNAFGKGTERTFSIAGLAILVSKYLKYYNEGYTDISDTVIVERTCQTLKEYREGARPIDFTESDGEYYDRRKDIYNFVIDNKPIFEHYWIN